MSTFRLSIFSTLPSSLSVSLPYTWVSAPFSWGIMGYSDSIFSLTDGSARILPLAVARPYLQICSLLVLPLSLKEPHSFHRKSKYLNKPGCLTHRSLPPASKWLVLIPLGKLSGCYPISFLLLFSVNTSAPLTYCTYCSQLLNRKATL